jgi:hypothetical protein
MNLWEHIITGVCGEVKPLISCLGGKKGEEEKGREVLLSP